MPPNNVSSISIALAIDNQFSLCCKFTQKTRTTNVFYYIFIKLKQKKDNNYATIQKFLIFDQLNLITNMGTKKKLLAEASDNVFRLRRTAANLNMIIKSGHIGDLIRVTEALQEKQLARIAEDIASRPFVRVVLLAGPSSSGKTSTSNRLAVQLMTNMKLPVALSMDNWFVNRDCTPVDEYGEKDFESIHAVDLPQFNQDLQDLIDGKEIKLPTYNFHTGMREYRGETLKLNHDAILIVEGIHALNPILTEKLPEDYKYHIFAAPISKIALNDEEFIPTSENRLLRRITRDSQTRNRTAQATIASWASVRRGEEKWILPFRGNADAIFDTAMVYELAAIKDKAVALLKEVQEDAPEYYEAKRLLNYLKHFDSITDEEIPRTSLLREFIGGSVFDVG